ncbi:pyruvate kinase [Hymenobacter lutimineralis]|uniref:Pyruvate kinase n=1 Tax=Hymenobacter lutimineralis TaxID=2606448 RepID=A0A5D6US41_9BACT|nr:MULTISPECIES: pyruvate kinase [Hymenobacter]QIX62434.1 pyruvate kinase [Hymenobacter sp. BT18]TYZ05937.1 pyruvate kinase [Hymenobacter lutimineralis]
MESFPKYNKTKIVATVGPASNTYEKLGTLIREGVDVFRLNFSHGAHEEHLAVINTVRRLNKDMRTNVGLLQDLQGPKIRLGDVEGGGVEIKPGDKIKLVCGEKEISTATRLSTIYLGLARDVKPGDMILIDDGKIELRVLATDRDKEVDVEVIYGGLVKPRKGINLPDSDVSAPSMTEKDIEDLKFGLENGVDWIALSFARRAEDIRFIKSLIAESGKEARVVAKIETPEGLRNLDEIIAITDAVMVARGDLGVEVKMEEVPMSQKMIVQKCNKLGKPVIVATQMMESMITAPRPTRAETSDVANAVMDGADALMLSAETAVGQYPVEVIRSMVATIRSVESQAEVFHRFYPIDPNSPSFMVDSVLSASVHLSRNTKAKALTGVTHKGYTAFQISKYRPKADIFIFTDNRPLLTALSLVWGVRGFYYDRFNSTDSTIADIKYILTTTGHLQAGDAFITTGSMPITEHGQANMMKVTIV